MAYTMYPGTGTPVTRTMPAHESMTAVTKAAKVLSSPVQDPSSPMRFARSPEISAMRYGATTTPAHFASPPLRSVVAHSTTSSSPVPTAATRAAKVLSSPMQYPSSTMQFARSPEVSAIRHGVTSAPATGFASPRLQSAVPSSTPSSINSSILASKPAARRDVGPFTQSSIESRVLARKPTTLRSVSRPASVISQPAKVLRAPTVVTATTPRVMARSPNLLATGNVVSERVITLDRTSSIGETVSPQDTRDIRLRIAGALDAALANGELHKFVKKTDLARCKVANGDSLRQAPKASVATKKKGVSALLKGLRSGEVSKIVDHMEASVPTVASI